MKKWLIKGFSFVLILSLILGLQVMPVSKVSAVSTGDKTAKIMTVYSMPSLIVSLTQIQLNYDHFDAECVIKAKIGDITYTSDFGSAYESNYNSVIITYPLQKPGQEVSVWLEGKDSSVKASKTYTISQCPVSLKDDMKVYPKQLSGTIDSSNVVKVAATIGSNTYQANVDSSGKYLFTYPAQNVGDTVNIIGYDSHGCASKTYTKKITNDYYIDVNQYIDKIYIKQTVVKSSQANQRLCIQIGSNIYYSGYSNNAGEELSITYSEQAVGTDVSLWFEQKDTGLFTDKVKKSIGNIDYYISKSNILNNSFNGEISSGTLSSATAVIAGTTYNGKVNGNTFTIEYPKQNFGQSITVNVVETNGYKASSTYQIKNIPIRLKVDSVFYTSKKVTGMTAAYSNVVIKVGNKTYTAKADKFGYFSAKIKSVKSGTKVAITSTAQNGFYKTVNVKVKSMSGFLSVKNDLFQGAKTLKIGCMNGNKGDIIQVKTAKKVYKKVLKKTKKNQTITLKVEAQKAGAKIKIKLLDKFKKTRTTENAFVYIGNDINVGMTESQIMMTTWDEPVDKNVYSSFIQYVFSSGDSYLYAYVRNGKVVDVEKHHF